MVNAAMQRVWLSNELTTLPSIGFHTFRLTKHLPLHPRCNPSLCVSKVSLASLALAVSSTALVNVSFSVLPNLTDDKKHCKANSKYTGSSSFEWTPLAFITFLWWNWVTFFCYFIRTKCTFYRPEPDSVTNWTWSKVIWGVTCAYVTHSLTVHPL